MLTWFPNTLAVEGVDGGGDVHVVQLLQRHEVVDVRALNRPTRLVIYSIKFNIIV
jgi:hypothetical protein